LADVSEVFVQPFPATGAKWQISPGGGQQTVWKSDGSELYYVSPDKRIMAVAVTSSARDFAVGPSRVVVQSRIIGGERTNHGSAFALIPDGERSLVSSATTDVVTPITLVLNWTSVLDR
jgi:hypothetical protein